MNSYDNLKYCRELTSFIKEERFHMPVTCSFWSALVHILWPLSDLGVKKLVVDNDTSFKAFILSKFCEVICWQFVTDVYDAQSVIYKHKAKNNIFLIKCFLFMEKLIRGPILYRLGDEIQEFKIIPLIVNRVFGNKCRGKRRGLGSCTKLLVLGEHFKQEYIKLGVEQEKIKIFGKVRLLDLGHKSKSRLDRDGIAFLFFLNKSLNPVYKEELRTIINMIASKFEAPSLKFKLHPKSEYTKQEFVEAMKLSNISFVFVNAPTELDKQRLISGCDFLVQKHSTICFDAVNLSVPVLSFNFKTSHEFDNMLEKLSGPYHSYTEFQFEENLNSIKTNPEFALQLVEYQSQSNFVKDSKALDIIDAVF